jgi:hypothetical protein
VKAQLGRRLVATRRRVGIVEAEVGHVPEHMTFRVLRHRLAEVRTDAAEGTGLFLDAQVHGLQPADQREAAAVLDLLPDPLQHGAQARQREVGGADRHQVDPALQRRHDGLADLQLLGRRQHVNPVVALLQLRAVPALRVAEHGQVDVGDGFGGHGSLPFQWASSARTADRSKIGGCGCASQARMSE